jgi:hypothetical protein
VAPWKGPRHRSWAANTNLATIAFAVIFGTYVTWEIVDTAPPGLVTLLGVASAAWFGAISDDKKKREAEVEETANRAERTAVRAEAKADAGGTRADAADKRAAAAEDRERGWSQHRDHGGGGSDG